MVGGGATGLGTAVDAAARGYRTLLLEAADFAKGMSSRSTKLVHGGVRYLAQGNVKLVREALHERGLLRQIDDPAAPKMLAPSQGVHLMLGREFLPGESAIMIPRTDDGRVLFAVPWHDRVIVGTTDSGVEKAVLEPRPLEQEIDFLVSHARRYLSRDPNPSDVLSIFAGLRPLVKIPGGMQSKEVPRDHALFVSPSGLVTITGGKWTTYRHMAEDTVDRAAKVGALAEKPSPTEELRLHGWQEHADESLVVYGSDAPALRQLMAERPALGERLHPALPYRAGEVVWAARYELARTVEDVLARRTRALLLDARASIEAAPRVAKLLAAELGKDADWRENQVARYRELASGYLLEGVAEPSEAPQLAVS